MTYATTADAACSWLADLGDVPYVAVDTETAGRDPWTDALRLVQVSAGPTRPVLVVAADVVDPAVLAPLLGDRSVLKVFHHGAFDLRFLGRAGLEVNRVADTMLAQQLLDAASATPVGASLALLADFRLGMALDKDMRDDFARRELTERHVRYAAEDAEATWGVFDQQWRELSGHGLVEVARIEFGALPPLAGLQLRGVGLDVGAWEALVDDLQQRLPELSDDAQTALVSEDTPRTLFGPEPVNLDSPEQVLVALRRHGLELESTRESVLRDHRDVPAVAALLAYRQVAKIVGAWGGGWARAAVHPVSGRIHADWRQIVGTGRIACSDPNLLQIPREARYRRCFRAGPGRTLVVADYGQQELRILAAVSGDPALIDVFTSGRDLHRTTAAMVFDTDTDAVTPEQRKAAKALNFGLLYGMGAAGFARSTGTSVAEAQETMDAWFAAFPQVAAWLARAEATGRRTGRVRTPLGRIRYLEQAQPTFARNAPIQGAGADMIKVALAEVDERLRAVVGSRLDGSPLGLVLVVHDEIVAEVPAETAEQCRREVVEGMLAAARRVLGDVPAVVDAAVQDTWGGQAPA